MSRRLKSISCLASSGLVKLSKSSNLYLKVSINVNRKFRVKIPGNGIQIDGSGIQVGGQRWWFFDQFYGFGTVPIHFIQKGQEFTGISVVYKNTDALIILLQI